MHDGKADKIERVGTTDREGCLPHCTVYYNPYKTKKFIDKDSGCDIISADFCDMDVEDMFPVIAINPVIMAELC